MNKELDVREKSDPEKDLTGESLIEKIVLRYEGEPGMLIPMLQDIQAEYGYLPADHLRSLSKSLKVPLARIYSVATFYASFRLAPKGQHEVTLCMGTVCYLKGSGRISETICGEFGVEPGGTTADRLFTLNLVNCVGACALAPVMIVDGKYYDAVTPESAVKVIHTLSSTDEPGEGGESEKEAPVSEKTVKSTLPPAPAAGTATAAEKAPAAITTPATRASTPAVQATNVKTRVKMAASEKKILSSEAASVKKTRASKTTEASEKRGQKPKTAKKTSAKKTSAKRVSAKQASSKQAPSKKAPPKGASSKKTSTNRTVTKKTARKK